MPQRVPALPQRMDRTLPVLLSCTVAFRMVRAVLPLISTNHISRCSCLSCHLATRHNRRLKGSSTLIPFSVANHRTMVDHLAMNQPRRRAHHRAARSLRRRPPARRPK
uniref:Putative secreted peptide n=1 Tax=Anopheles braziliensis TaxID=58242 RepID=A0A2M3ZVK8_9DIPT